MQLIFLDYLQEFLIHRRFQAHLCSKFFNKSLFNNIEIPEISCYEDALIFPDILIKSENIFITNSVFYNYIKRSDSLSNKITHQKADIMANVILYMNDKFDNRYHNLIATHAIEHLLKNEKLLSNEKKLGLKKIIEKTSKISYFLDPKVRLSFKIKLLKL
ncbi:hypothetical protein PSI15_11815 [Xenorhabdus sp. PR6a]|nr:hypothetical protein [Xenorhabdus sp. PR6a]